MRRRFKVEHKNYEKPIIYVTLHQPPYENENILYKTKWKEKDCKITEISSNFDEDCLETEVSPLEKKYDEGEE